MSPVTTAYSAGITIEHPGLLSTIQDRGRFGLRHLGIPWSGALTPVWQRMANALVGNPLDDSIIECFEGGLRFHTFGAPIRIATLAAADMIMKLGTTDGTVSLRPGRSYTLPANTTVSLLSTGRFRHALIAVQGIQAVSQLGSTSTYAKAGLGGIGGHALSVGVSLEVSASPQGPETQCAVAPPMDYLSTILRVVMGPQDDHFSASGQEAFLSGDYQLSTDVDRMGARLTGTAIEHRDEAARDIVSDAIVPGSIQVPGNGQPIVLLNDAHTAGGYPKIATVISIDLPLLGLQRPGSSFRFKAMSLEEAIDAVREHETMVKGVIERISPVKESAISSESLFSTNLIDGVTDGFI